MSFPKQKKPRKTSCPVKAGSFLKRAPGKTEISVATGAKSTSRYSRCATMPDAAGRGLSLSDAPSRRCPETAETPTRPNIPLRRAISGCSFLLCDNPSLMPKIDSLGRADVNRNPSTIVLRRSWTVLRELRRAETRFAWKKSRLDESAPYRCQPRNSPPTSGKKLAKTLHWPNITRRSCR